MADIRIHDDNDALMQAAAAYVAETAEKAIADNGAFTIAMAGGGTPRPLYEHLGSEPYKSRINWQMVHIFWGDERAVPPDDKDSNYRMVSETLLQHVGIPAGQIHRIKGEIKPEDAAVDYEKVLKGFFATLTPPGQPVMPRFDLMLLGMGHDGHTLSIFPGTSPIHEQEKWVVGHYIAGRDMWRITLTPPAMNAAKRLAFLVAGDNKAASLKAVLEGDYAPEKYPSQLAKPTDGEVVWFVDQAAAAQL